MADQGERTRAARSEAPAGRPRIGLALSGGGALGAAHIGVLDVLNDAGIRADMVAGTSIGALVGAAYVTGKLRTLERLARQANRFRILQMADIKLLGPGLLGGEPVERMLAEHFGTLRLDYLDPPLAVTTVDLASGRLITLKEGSLVDALRASISIPGVFSPVVTGDAVLVDGGLIEPLPVAACRALGADFVIAVDLLADYEGAARIAKVEPGRRFKARTIEVFAASVALVMRELTRVRLEDAPADIVIAPQVGHLAPHEFHRSAELIERGRVAARTSLADLKSRLDRLTADSRPHAIRDDRTA